MKGMVDYSPSFKVGDPCPDGYSARIEWAAVHMKAGLRQVRCCKCGLYQFPHELSGQESVSNVSKTKHGPTFKKVGQICKQCAITPQVREQIKI